MCVSERAFVFIFFCIARFIAWDGILKKAFGRRCNIEVLDMVGVPVRLSYLTLCA